MIYLELDDQQAELVEQILRAWHDKTWGTGKDADGIAMPGNNTEAVKKVLDQIEGANEQPAHRINRYWEEILEEVGSDGVLEWMDEQQVLAWVIAHVDEDDILSDIDNGVIANYYKENIR